MRVHRRPFRVTALFVFLLQVIAQGALPVADAALEPRDPVLGAHVEAQSQDGCNSGHDHAACVICRSLQTATSPSRAEGRLVFATSHLATRPAADLRDPGSGARTPAQPRAPPLG